MLARGLTRGALIRYGAATAIATAAAGRVVGRHRPTALCEQAAGTRSTSSTSSTSTTAATPTKLVLFQYQICPFCNRVKAYLDFFKIPYDVVEVNPLTKAELAFSANYKKVPVLVVDGAQYNDSAAIINAVTQHFVDAQSNSSFFPEDTDKWSEWSEKKLAVYLYPNITRSFSESYECFGYTSSVASWNVVSCGFLPLRE
jgi:microsomal prostaglandin-E synthase 2